MTPDDFVIAELDFGNQPHGWLVIRESRGTRVAGMCICLVLAAVFVLMAVVLRRDSELLARWIFAGLAAVLVAIGLWLFHQCLSIKAFYIAADDSHLVRRRGRRFFALPLKDIAGFQTRRGALYAVTEGPDGQPVKTELLKAAYAPANLSSLAETLEAWRRSPASERTGRLENIAWKHVAQRKRVANRLLLSGVATACLGPLAIALLVRAPVNAWRGLLIFHIGLAVLLGLGQVMAGVLIRMAARQSARGLTARPPHDA